MPWSVAQVNAPVTADARHHAHDQADTVDATPIATWGDEREAQIRQAIGIGRHPIVFGSMVDWAYTRLGCDWTPQEPLGPVAGGHAQLVVGYDAEGVHVLNSWGPGWGVGGLARLTWRFARSHLRDLYVIRKVRRLAS
jgi:hypothetical protein